MKSITCCHEVCGITFDVPDGWHSERLSSGANFFCPNGHPQSFTGKRDENKALKDRIENLLSHNNILRFQRDYADKRASTYKGHYTRVKNLNAPVEKE